MMNDENIVNLYSKVYVDGDSTLTLKIAKTILPILINEIVERDLKDNKSHFDVERFLKFKNYLISGGCRVLDFGRTEINGHTIGWLIYPSICRNEYSIEAGFIGTVESGLVKDE